MRSQIKYIPVSYTHLIPVEAALDAVRSGENPELTTREKHTREVFVVAEEGADKAKIETEIKTMPNYFDEYDTTVHFISEEEMKKNHTGLPHGGFVIRTGKTGWEDEHDHVIEYLSLIHILALVEGCFHTKTGQIKMPIGKIPEEKMKMCVNEKGKSADTQYEVLETFLIEGKFYSLVGCRIATGRTHQIRVHMAWMGHPVVGDVLYGHDGEGQVNPFFTGLGLHAERVSFQQPYTGKKIVIENVPKHWFLEDIRKKGLTRQI